MHLAVDYRPRMPISLPTSQEPSWHAAQLLFHGRCGASLGGSLCNTHNLTLGLFFGTCLHMMSGDDQERPQHTKQTHNKHQHHHHGDGGVDLMNPHRLPPEGWVALRMLIPRLPSNGFNGFVKIKKKSINWCLPLCFIEIGLTRRQKWWPKQRPLSSVAANKIRTT